MGSFLSERDSERARAAKTSVSPGPTVPGALADCPPSVVEGGGP
jgi:hypothetical protein